MGPHTFFGQSIPDCDQDILLTDVSRTQQEPHLVEERIFWKVYIEKETHGIEKKTSLTFPVVLEDEKVWAAESGQLLIQNCSEITVERSSSQIQIGINKEKEGKGILEWLHTKTEEG